MIEQTAASGEILERTIPAPIVDIATDRRAILRASLPEESDPYIDKYFLRTRSILEQSNLNPWIRAQVIIRQGPGEVRGINEALAILEKYSGIKEHGGKIWALPEGSTFEAGENVLQIECPIQDIVALETIYLGVISAETTLAKDPTSQIDLEHVKENMRKVVVAAQGRPVFYFGARHWRYDEDAAISKACFDGGAIAASTDVGASTFGQKGVGTIPHVLENIMAAQYGYSRGVVESTVAFDKYIDPRVPRIALIDYNNREIEDALATARALGTKLNAVRVDTCGENVAQGALLGTLDPQAKDWTDAGISLLPETDPDAKYWYGHGVTVTGVYALRKALDDAGYGNVQIVLSSGFADVKKVNAFVRAEKILGTKLFDMLGVGGVFPSQSAKMDIVAVGDTPETMMPISKAGRHYKPNPRLERVNL